MKKISFKNLSVLGLVLLGVSAITTAMIPSKTDAKNTQNPENGFSRLSSNGGGETVTEGVGLRSWTQTGPAGNNADLLSATSQDDDGTFTGAQVGNDTEGGTTATAQE